jgi:hypothetical protein
LSKIRFGGSFAAKKSEILASLPGRNAISFILKIAWIKVFLGQGPVFPTFDLGPMSICPSQVEKKMRDTKAAHIN